MPDQDSRGRSEDYLPLRPGVSEVGARGSDHLSQERGLPVTGPTEGWSNTDSRPVARCGGSAVLRNSQRC